MRSADWDSAPGSGVSRPRPRNRVGALRFEQAVSPVDDVPACDGALADFAEQWRRSGYTAEGAYSPVFDGPVQRSARNAMRHGQRVGRFEADFRASRAECRVALVLSVTQP